MAPDLANYLEMKDKDMPIYLPALSGTIKSVILPLDVQANTTGPHLPNGSPLQWQESSSDG